jgi:hypothetical protein
MLSELLNSLLRRTAADVRSVVRWCPRGRG